MEKLKYIFPQITKSKWVIFHLGKLILESLTQKGECLTILKENTVHFEIMIWTIYDHTVSSPQYNHQVAWHFKTISWV